MKKLLKKILAVGLSASMMLGMAVTSFAESEPETEPTTPTAPSATVWVNGKDVKANSTKKIEESKAKTATVKVADLKTKETPTFLIEDEYKDKVTADLSKVTKEGSIVYKKKATTTKGTFTVTIKDASALALDTYTYSPAVAASGTAAAQDAKWSDSKGNALDAAAISVSGTPAKDDTFKVELAWDTTDCKDITISKTDASVAEDTVVKIVQKVQIGLSASLPEKTKYLMSVTGTDVTTYTDAFPGNKAAKSDMAKVKYDKKNTAFTVTSGKTKGEGKVWIAEFSSAKKAITAYTSFDLTVKMAPSKFSVQIPAVKADPEKQIEAKDAITKKSTVSVGDTITLETLVSKPAAEDVTADTTYKWTVKLPKGAKEADVVITPAKDTKTATVNFVKMPDNKKAANYTITCTNVQSQKKATFKVTVINNVKAGTVPAVAVNNAYEEKQTATIKLGTAESNIVLKTDASGDTAITKLETTDKVKAFVSAISESDAKGYTLDKGEKKDTFKVTAKSKEISAKMDKEGTVTVTAKKGTLPGTTANLLIVVTHKDKTISVYENVITVGKAATALDATTKTFEVAPGKTLDLATKLTTKTPADADVVWTTDNKGVATVDSKGKVTAKKAGEAKITATSGSQKVEFTITVKAPEVTTTTTTKAS